MRTIKFNIYDTYLKQYVCKGIDIKGEFMSSGGLEMWCDKNPNPNHKHSLQRLDDIVFLQFTGLLDKNNVEIYEGDITSWEEDGIKGNINLQIQFWDGGFVKTDKKESDFTNLTKSNIDRSHCKVIGDIYTNPELI